MRRYFLRRQTRNLLRIGAASFGALLVGLVVPQLFYRSVPPEVPAALASNTPRQAAVTVLAASTGAPTVGATEVQPTLARPAERRVPTATPPLRPTLTQTLDPTATATATQTPTASPTETPTEVPVPLGMALVPGGNLLMGASEHQDNEIPEQLVVIDAYYLDLYEVSNARYAQCVDDGACEPPQSWASFTRASYYANPEFANYPVVNVTWHQAKAYCDWADKRLPTEAEWEFAAGGPENYTWPWGNTFEIGRNAVADSDTQPVNSYPSGISPFGLFNMAGNVAEWVADVYLLTLDATLTPEQSLDAPRVYRGGSFGNPDETAYSTSRRYNKTPTFSDVDIGFRCAKTAATLDGGSGTTQPG